MTSWPSSPTVRAPSRSTSRPPGTCRAAWETNSALVNSPTTTSETPYERASSSATGATFATFQPAEKPSAAPATPARLLRRGGLGVGLVDALLDRRRLGRRLHLVRLVAARLLEGRHVVLHDGVLDHLALAHLLLRVRGRRIEREPEGHAAVR